MSKTYTDEDGVVWDDEYDKEGSIKLTPYGNE